MRWEESQLSAIMASVGALSLLVAVYLITHWEIVGVHWELEVMAFPNFIATVIIAWRLFAVTKKLDELKYEKGVIIDDVKSMISHFSAIHSRAVLLSAVQPTSIEIDQINGDLDVVANYLEDVRALLNTIDIDLEANLDVILTLLISYYDAVDRVLQTQRGLDAQHEEAQIARNIMRRSKMLIMDVTKA